MLQLPGEGVATLAGRAQADGPPPRSQAEPRWPQVCVISQNGRAPPSGVSQAAKRRRASAAAPPSGLGGRQPSQAAVQAPAPPRPPQTGSAARLGRPEPAGRFTFTPRVHPPRLCVRRGSCDLWLLAEVLPSQGAGRLLPAQDLPDAAFEDTHSPVPALQGLLKTLSALQPEDQRQQLRHPSVQAACTAALRSLQRIPEQVRLQASPECTLFWQGRLGVSSLAAMSWTLAHLR